MTAFTTCQSCGSPLPKPFLSLGSLPLCNELHPIDAPPAPQTTYPLELIRCDECTLVQLSFVPPSEIVFPSSYPYLSGMTKALRENFADLGACAARTLEFLKDDLVVDIGSNDGTLLSNFKDTCRVLGITPEDAAKTAEANGIETLQGYFGSFAGDRMAHSFGKAKLITCTNCFAHVPDPNDFLRGVTTLLANGGAFVTESTYWGDTVRDCSWDTIYSEHARMLALQSIVPMLARHGLEVFRVQRIPTHGGSIRVWACRRGERQIEPSVAVMLDEERKTLSGEALTRFAERTRYARRDLRNWFFSHPFATVHGIGAPSRASTLLSYCGITADDLPVVYEAPGSHKIGKLMPGSAIRVVEEPSEFGDDQPTHLMLLSWHIGDTLIESLRRKGFRGAFVKPLPTVEVMT